VFFVFYVEDSGSVDLNLDSGSNQTCHRRTPPLLLQAFNGLFPRTTWVSRYQTGKTSLGLNEVKDDGVLGCSGISWTICKQSAHRCRQITTPAPHHSQFFTGQMLFLPPNQQCQITEGLSPQNNMAYN